MVRRDDSDEDIGFEPAHIDEMQPKLEPHQFETLPQPEKIDRLLNLYFGVVHNLEDVRRQLGEHVDRVQLTRKWMANHEIEYQEAVKRVNEKLDYLTACQAIIMHSLGIQVPKHGAPPSEPPKNGGEGHGNGNGNGSHGGNGSNGDNGSDAS